MCVCMCVCMCVYVGRKKSLRSLEIPLDNLLSGIIFTAGRLQEVGVATIQGYMATVEGCGNS